ncbi:MAG: alpha/beta fold hydrolase [Ignavibacteriae bacterium]|nr:alpha/beta fold hydrolase [Ignavibacteriota bacterium]
MVRREQFDIPAKTYDGRPFTLRAVRLVNEGHQPLILWEGFYQNGMFFDLMSGEGSVAQYLCANGFDVWIIDSRGNGGSTGKAYPASMDDFAAIDIPAVIFFVIEKTRSKPIYIGHSQGGNTALMSMMGVCKTFTGEVYFSDEESEIRQSSLKALVTLGSYLDFTFSKPSSLQEFVRNGIVISLFGKKIQIMSSTSLLNMLKIFTRIPVPVPLSLREAMVNSRLLRWLLFPLTFLLNIISTLKSWEFLYHIPNVTGKARRYLFYRTMQATYWGILAQYQQSILHEQMTSSDGRVNYSENYPRVLLPISVVTMEYDTLADPVETKRIMFPKLGSKQKYFTEWMQQGHEDFVMNPGFFHQLIDAIGMVNAGDA